MEAVRPDKKPLLEQNNNFMDDEPPIPEPMVLPPESEVVEEKP
jgi:hypothetical protein